MTIDPLRASVTLDAEFAGATPGVRGISLAFARDIANELEAKLDAAGSSPRQIKHHKRLSRLRKHFFGIEAILCHVGDWKDEIVPTRLMMFSGKKLDGEQTQSAHFSVIAATRARRLMSLHWRLNSGSVRQPPIG